MSSRERRNKLAKCVCRWTAFDWIFFHDIIQLYITYDRKGKGRIDESKSWSYIAAEFATRRGLNCKLAGNRYYLGHSPISNWEDRTGRQGWWGFLWKTTHRAIRQNGFYLRNSICICPRKLQKLMRPLGNLENISYVYIKKKEEKKVKVSSSRLVQRIEDELIPFDSFFVSYRYLDRLARYKRSKCP